MWTGDGEAAAVTAAVSDPVLSYLRDPGYTARYPDLAWLLHPDADWPVRLRKHAGWTQADVAGRFGVSTPAISYWENHHTLPDEDHAAEYETLLLGWYDAYLGDETRENT